MATCFIAKKSGRKPNIKFNVMFSRLFIYITQYIFLSKRISAIISLQFMQHCGILYTR